MIVGKTISSSVYGYSALPIQVEADILKGNFGIQIVGLPDSTGRESKERIRSAIQNSGFHFPPFFNLINLSPNELPKEGALLELASAVAVLIASGQLPQEFFYDKMLLGSLSLDGSIHPARGMVSSCIMAIQREEIQSVILPQKSMAEAAQIPGLKAYPIETLADLKSLIHNDKPLASSKPFLPEQSKFQIDMNEIIGQEKAKNALAYAASGYHHTLMIGSPGTGKSMLARAMKGILPPLKLFEALEVTSIYSSMELNDNRFISRAPFRSPHHTSSDIALVGGGIRLSPGEISLAHRGVLFLDELSEFKGYTLQSLREPLEEGKISISRARGQITFPADFILLAAMNPCSCGYILSEKHYCSCKASSVMKIYQKIQGPFLDRIAIEVETIDDFLGEEKFKQNSKNSLWYQNKIIETRERLSRRIKDQKKLNSAQLMKIINSSPMSSSLQNLTRELGIQKQLSHRGMLNTLRLAVTIMEFQEKEFLNEDILVESFSFRKVNDITMMLSRYAA